MRNMLHMAHKLANQMVFDWNFALFKYVILFLLSLHLSFAQQYDLRFKTIDHKQGLSSKRISAVLQDSNGIFWMGNRIAVDRYDGNQTISFTLSRNSNINQLSEDVHNNIWAATYTGLYVLIKGEKEFKKIHFKKDLLKVEYFDF